MVVLLRKEAATTLRPIFQPLAAALRQGNFAAFQQTLKMHEPFLFQKGLLITLGYRLRPLLWRSLSRRTFLLTYIPPPTTDTSRKAATLDLADLLAAVSLAQKQLEGYVPAQPAPRARAPHTNTLFMKAVRNSVPPGGDSTLVAPPGGPKKLRPSEGVLWGNLAIDAGEVEGMVATLVAQGLLHGFVAHSAGKFAVVGAKGKGSAILAGWPPVAEAIRTRLDENDNEGRDVPAWVTT
jgi:nuclear mRNA export protein PCID2/THP1